MRGYCFQSVNYAGRLKKGQAVRIKKNFFVVSKDKLIGKKKLRFLFNKGAEKEIHKNYFLPCNLKIPIFRRKLKNKILHTLKQWTM